MLNHCVSHNYKTRKSGFTIYIKMILKCKPQIENVHHRYQFQERRIVISHKLDTQEALTKSNQLNMELQAQLDSLIEARDSFEQVIS